MRVLLVSPLPPPAGGIATWTKKYIQYFEENHLSCEVINTAVIGVREKEINHKKNYFEELKRALSIYLRAKERIKTYRPDIAHINSSCTTFGVMRDYVVIRLLNKNKIPIVLHCRCNIEDQLHGKLPSRLFLKMVRSSCAVLTLNKQSRDYVESLDPNKAMILPNFIEADRLVVGREINKKIAKILFVGHVWRPKGVVEIIEAAKRLPEIQFVLVGPIREDIKGMNIPSNTDLTGEKDSAFVRKQLEESDIFLFPSYTEGFANALAEAMAAGLPIVATPVGANKDMVEEHGGILVPVGDVEAIVSAINKLSDYDTRKNMSHWNIDKVKNNYLLESVMERLLQIYSEVLDNA